MTASALGNLNAAHASAMAMSKASINSIVGKIGALVESETISQTTLSEISNKSKIAGIPVSPDVVEAVNDLVEGKSVDRSEAEAEDESSDEGSEG